MVQILLSLQKHIQLADNPVIYSARIISVIFEPIVKENWVQAAEFSQVLYVPNLRSNLLSYLYLIHNKNFEIYISLSAIFFKLNVSILFMETINYKNSAILNITTITLENALSVSTIPTDLFLWYYYFTYYNYTNVKIIEHKLVLNWIHM